MILLTDGEMEEAVNYDEVARDQLKKVGEWGDGDCEHLESRKEYTRPLRARKKCWQVLKKEAGG